VLPPGVRFPQIALAPKIVFQETAGNALLFEPLAPSERDLNADMGNFNYKAIARLKPGMTLAQANTELEARIASRSAIPRCTKLRKDKQWYFGMKAHVGVDSKTKLIHTALVTPAQVADATVLPDLLHGEETRVWGDQAYRGQTEVIQECAPRAQDCTHRRYRFKYYTDEVERTKNRTKSTVRSKVEHVFGMMKLKFGFVKVRYRGLARNANRLFATCALVNLFTVRKKLPYSAA
jgi:IS5 family transposase